MADNVTIPPTGTGTAAPVVATDDVGGAHYQRFKLDLGADGAADPVVGTVPISDSEVTASDTLSSLNDAFTVDVRGAGSVVLYVVSSTLAGSHELRSEMTLDGTNWFLFPMLDGTANTVTTIDTVVAAGDYYVINPGAAHSVRLRLDVYTSGSASLVARVSTFPSVLNPTSIQLRNAATGYAAEVDQNVDALDSSAFTPLRVASFANVYNASLDAWNYLRGDTLGVHVSRQATAATATLTNVNDTASSTTLLASNTSRKGATIHNDSTAILYVKFGTTASLTSYTVKMVADSYYEVPFGYTGRIDGIWASDASGAARMTELT